MDNFKKILESQVTEEPLQEGSLKGVYKAFYKRIAGWTGDDVRDIESVIWGFIKEYENDPREVKRLIDAMLRDSEQEYLQNNPDQM